MNTVVMFFSVRTKKLPFRLLKEKRDNSLDQMSFAEKRAEANPYYG